MKASLWYCMSSSTLCLIFWGWFSHWTWSSVFWLDLVTSELKEPVSLLPALSPMSGLKVHTALPGFYISIGNLNSDTHTYTASTLPSQLASWRCFCFVFNSLLHSTTLSRELLCVSSLVCICVYMYVWACVYVSACMSVCALCICVYVCCVCVFHVYFAFVFTCMRILLNPFSYRCLVIFILNTGFWFITRLIFVYPSTYTGEISLMFLFSTP